MNGPRILAKPEAYLQVTDGTGPEGPVSVCVGPYYFYNVYRELIGIIPKFFQFMGQLNAQLWIELTIFEGNAVTPEA
ncbi:hypothetical protein GCM10027292_16810 [Hydrogenophaga aquatica]